MSTPAPASALQEAGDPCASCADFWQEKQKPPRIMEDTHLTTDKGIPIIVCSFCDGDELLKRHHDLEN